MVFVTITVIVVFILRSSAYFDRFVLSQKREYSTALSILFPSTISQRNRITIDQQFVSCSLLAIQWKTHTHTQELVMFHIVKLDKHILHAHTYTSISSDSNSWKRNREREKFTFMVSFICLFEVDVRYMFSSLKKKVFFFSSLSLSSSLFETSQLSVVC